MLAHHGVSKVSSRFSPPRQVEFFRDVNRNSDDDDEMECADEAAASDSGGSSSSEGEGGEGGRSRRHKLNVVSVACGKSHSMALTDGGLFVWGSSRYGQLGLGRGRQSVKQPEQVVALGRRVVMSVAAGHYHSAALDTHGRLWTWGWGVHGQLGLGGIEDEHWPKVRTINNDLSCLQQCTVGWCRVS